MGKYLNWMKSKNAHVGALAFWQGGVLLLLGCLTVLLLSIGLMSFIRLLPFWLAALCLALVLKPFFSVRALLKAGQEIRQALEQADLAEAQHLLAWNLVSRDTSELKPCEVAGAAISSLAENVTDSIVAPLVCFALFGLPGAAVYRFVNTADAILGYRTPELEYFGKAAAWLDDALNYIPSRLSAVLILLALASGRWRAAWRSLRSDAQLTPSPNGGITMAAAAGGLGVRLEKRDVYVLNPLGNNPRPEDLANAEQLVLRVSVLCAACLAGLKYAAS